MFLRYYATFKVRKFGSLLHKINPCLQKTTTCIGLQAEQIFPVNIQYTYFSILGVAFAVPFLYYLQKLQLLVVKNFRNNFCCIVLLFLWAQKVCLRFLKSYFGLEIILSFVESFLVDMFNHWKKLQFCKVILVQDYTENANGDVHLIVENVWYF